MDNFDYSAIGQRIKVLRKKKKLNLEREMKFNLQMHFLSLLKKKQCMLITLKEEDMM